MIDRTSKALLLAIIFGLIVTSAGLGSMMTAEWSKPNVATTNIVTKTVVTNSDPGCANDLDNRSSSICAEWNAVDAARESADWAHRSWWLSGLQLAFSGLGIIFVVRSLRQTEANLVEMKITNELTRSQNRPYLMPVDLGIRYEHEPPEEGLRPSANAFIDMKIANVGNGIAILERFGIKLEGGFGASAGEPFHKAVIATGMTYDPKFLVGGGTHAEIMDQYFKFPSGANASRLFGYFRYLETGGRRYRTHFSYTVQPYPDELKITPNPRQNEWRDYVVQDGDVLATFT